MERWSKFKKLDKELQKSLAPNEKGKVEMFGTVLVCLLQAVLDLLLTIVI